MATSARTYNDALDALNSLQTPFAVLQAKKQLGRRPDKTYIQELRVYLQRIGHSVADLDRLNIVHVAGTKGKGSTCAFVDSILTQYRLTRGTPSKTGLLISPHLIAVRERIRINSAPISEGMFAQYFFEVYDGLGESQLTSDLVELGSRPAYARFLTLMSWHVFLREGVDIAVYETGIGGEYDSTNVVERPVATGISTLGIDHVYALGDTVDKIAWHKAGIMKTGSPAFSVTQVPGAVDVLQSRAVEKGVELEVLDIDPRLEGVAIRPNAQFQKKNATLAVALATAALSKIGVPGMDSMTTLPKQFKDGLEKVDFRGRCEVKHDGKVTWHVDGAHTADSLKMSSKWFAEETASKTHPRILIFNQQGRAEALDFLDSIHEISRSSRPAELAEKLQAFEHVVFCTNVTYAKTGYKRDFVHRGHDPKEIEGMTQQRRFAEKWAALDPGADVKVIPTIEEALDYARGLAEKLPEGQVLQAFVTGSLHLVGGALGILEKADAL